MCATVRHRFWFSPRAFNKKGELRAWAYGPCWRSKAVCSWRISTRPARSGKLIDVHLETARRRVIAQRCVCAGGEGGVGQTTRRERQSYVKAPSSALPLAALCMAKASVPRCTAPYHGLLLERYFVRQPVKSHDMAIM